MKRFEATQGRRLYRSRNGVIFGVCRGLAEYFDLKVGWIRFFTVLAFMLTGIWPVLALYVAAALLMKLEPAVPFADDEQRDFYDNYLDDRQRTLRDLKRRFGRLDRRLQRLEDRVTSRGYDWEQRLNG